MVLFDAVADRYDAFCETPLGRFVDQVERALIDTLLEAAADEQIVDLGCGTGAYTASLAAQGCRVTGVDISPRMLALAAAKVRPGQEVRLLCADLAHLPLPANHFDAGLMQVTLEFVEDPRAVLREAVRVLKPGGRLVLGLIHGTGPWAEHYRQRAAKDPLSVYRSAHFWTVAEVEQLLGVSEDMVAGGLFVGPGDFRAIDEALAQDAALRATRPHAEAGFVAARFRVE